MSPEYVEAFSRGLFRRFIVTQKYNWIQLMNAVKFFTTKAYVEKNFAVGDEVWLYVARSWHHFGGSQYTVIDRLNAALDYRIVGWTLKRCYGRPKEKTKGCRRAQQSWKQQNLMSEAAQAVATKDLVRENNTEDCTKTNRRLCGS